MRISRRVDYCRDERVAHAEPIAGHDVAHPGPLEYAICCESAPGRQGRQHDVAPLSGRADGSRYAAVLQPYDFPLAAVPDFHRRLRIGIDTAASEKQRPTLHRDPEVGKIRTETRRRRFTPAKVRREPQRVDNRA